MDIHDYFLTYPDTPRERYLSPPIHTHAHAFPHQTINIAPHTILSPGVINASGQGNAHNDPCDRPGIPSYHPLQSVNWSKSLDEREKNLAAEQQTLAREQHLFHQWSTHNRRTFEEQQKYLKDTRHKINQSEKVIQNQFDVISQASNYIVDQHSQLKESSAKAKAEQDNLTEILNEIRNECAAIIPATHTLTSAIGVILDQFTFIFDTVLLKHGPQASFYLFRLLAPSIEKILQFTHTHRAIPELEPFEPSALSHRRFDHVIGRLVAGIKYKVYKSAPGFPSYFEPLHSKEPSTPSPSYSGDDTESLEDDDHFIRFSRTLRDSRVSISPPPRIPKSIGNTNGHLIPPITVLSLNDTPQRAN
jgi:hypothetical protein